MTNAQIATILDQVIAEAFAIACLVPGSEASAKAHEIASTAQAAVEAIEQELENAYYDEMAKRHEQMLDAQADAISAHWGHD